MLIDLEQQILRLLQTRNATDRPVTISDFARQFGANPQVVVRLARSLVDNGLARPSMVMVHGVSTLHGLLPQPTPTPVAGS